MFPTDPNSPVMNRGGMGPMPGAAPQAAPALQQHSAILQNYGIQPRPQVQNMPPAPKPAAPPPAYTGKPLTGPQNAWNSQQWDEYHRQQSAKGVDQNALYNQGQQDAFRRGVPQGVDSYGRPLDPNAPLANPFAASSAAGMQTAMARPINDPNSFEAFYAKQWGDPQGGKNAGWATAPGTGMTPGEGSTVPGGFTSQNGVVGWDHARPNGYIPPGAGGLGAQMWASRGGHQGGFDLNPFGGHLNINPFGGKNEQAPEYGSQEDRARAMAYWKHQQAIRQWQGSPDQRAWDSGNAAYHAPPSIAPYNPYDNATD